MASFLSRSLVASRRRTLQLHSHHVLRSEVPRTQPLGKSLRMNSYSTKQESASPARRSPSLGATSFLDNTHNSNTEETVIQLLNRHEASISDQARLPSDDPTDSSQQVKLLQAIHAQLASQSTPLQFVWNAVLQTVVVIIAFLFGMFSIFSWHGQYKANRMTAQANQISLLSICLSNNVVSTVALRCRRMTTDRNTDTHVLRPMMRVQES